MLRVSVNNYKKAVPAIFTMLNFLGGLSSIFFTIMGNHSAAAWLIIAAVLCDALDGKLARMTGSESELGFLIDTLADLVTSGIAPAALAFSLTAGLAPVPAALCSGLYALCAAYRLARYTCIQRKEETAGYLGLPAPIAAFTLAGYWLFNFRQEVFFPQLWWILLVLFSILMVTGFYYDWPALDFSNRRRRVFSIAKLTATAGMILLPGYLIFIFFSAYILTGAVKGLTVFIKKEKEKKC